MPFIDYETCEPLRIWTRLEPRSRDVDFDGALAAPVADALWMLSRQWQMGEFQGEDTGSAVLAKIARRLTPVAGHELGTQVEPEDGKLPAEARIERLAIEFDPLARAQIGRTFLATLAQAAAEASPPPTIPFSLATYRTRLRTEFGIQPDAAPGDEVARARARASARARRTTAALAGRAVDGVELHRALVDAAPALPTALAGATAPEHLAIMTTAAKRFRAWFEALYPPPPAGGEAWDPQRLEYRSACTVPVKAGHVRLTLAEHVSGHLDWWAYDQDTVTSGAASSVTDVRTVIPSPARFPGMPNPRWWQFEDAAVDLGNFHAQATDLARIVVAEFALVYGNNWFVVPYRQPVGTLAEIEGIVVTDVFGQRTLVGPAVPASSGSWSSWDLFSLSPRGTTAVTPALGQHLFLPSAIAQSLDGEPRETVTLVRDEAADLVWGVERRVGGEDGVEAARRFIEALRQIVSDSAEGQSAAATTNGSAPAPALRYLLGTEVSESWIPFIPVHVDNGDRAIQLQRASMPRFVHPDDDPQPVRPRTSILRYGLSALDEAVNAYLLDEEEVPRIGVTVTGGLRRARWLDGRTVVWHGRGVSSGRGEVDSGLRFDVVEPVEVQ